MKFDFEGKSLYIDKYLAEVLDSIVYNIKKDWDFIIVVTGNRTVRVGKSVLGMTVGAYLSTHLGKVGIKSPFGIKNIFFDSKDMIKAGLHMPPHQILQYDEGREGLASSKYAKEVQQDLLDFFAECGQLNHIFIIVLPDFFELAESVAVPRSECLLNVYRSEQNVMMDLYNDGVPRPITMFKRGRFMMFGRKRKQALYEKAKMYKRKNYGLVKAKFVGSFTNQWPLPKEEYETAKRVALSRFEAKKKKAADRGRKGMTLKQQKMLYALIKEADRSHVRDLCREIGAGPTFGTTFMRDFAERHHLKENEKEDNVTT